jgi:hypothetical protein
MSTEEKKYDIFLSYYGKSLNKVQRLHQTLVETYKMKIWVDFVEIKENEIAFPKVREGIEKSTLFLVCLTKDYEKDDNCLIELQLAKEVFKKQLFIVFFQRIDFRDVPKIANQLHYKTAFGIYNAPIFDKGLWLRSEFINKLKLILQKSVSSINDISIYNLKDFSENQVEFAIKTVPVSFFFFFSVKII